MTEKTRVSAHFAKALKTLTCGTLCLSNVTLETRFLRYSHYWRVWYGRLAALRRRIILENMSAATS